MKLTHRMFTPALLVLGICAASAATAANITGAGATFPYPVYAKWAEAYKAKTGNSMNYQSIGSGGGIKQIKAKTVDFGASDAPLKLAELEKEGLVHKNIHNLFDYCRDLKEMKKILLSFARKPRVFSPE